MRKIKIARDIMIVIFFGASFYAIWYFNHLANLEAEPNDGLVLFALGAMLSLLVICTVLDMLYRNRLWEAHIAPVRAAYAYNFCEMLAITPLWDYDFYQKNPSSLYAAIAVAAFEAAWVDHSVQHVQFTKEEVARHVIKYHAKAMKLDRSEIPTVLEAVKEGNAS